MIVKVKSDLMTKQKTDNGIGIEFEVKKNTKNANRIGFSNSLFAVGEKVYIISEQERFDLMKRLERSPDTTGDDFQKQLQDKDDLIENLKNDNSKKDDLIKDLTARIDILGKEVEELPESKEIELLKEELATSQAEEQYWKNAHDSLVESSDDLSARNDELLKDNNRLKNSNHNINETNKLLNENIIAINNNYSKTNEELQSRFDNNEKELKQTINNQQTHIDELNKKVESLSALKEYIPPKDHYDEVNDLKDKISNVQGELDKLNAEVEVKLTEQKSEMEIAHTEEKAQILLAYNNELNNHKLKYNELAHEYNHLLSDANSLSRSNTLFNGRHKAIVKDKEPVELEEVEVEKLPTDIVEYVPKDQLP